MNKENAYTVTSLCNIIHNIFNLETELHDIYLLGEVSGLSIVKGHAYFTIKDDTAQLSCCCFSCSKTYSPKNGETVLLLGSPDFYTKGGRLNFNVSKIEPYGIGLLHKKIQDLKIKLEKEGLFDDRHKKAIPRFATNICVVTSKTGAVIRDIVTTTKKKNNHVKITICDVRVQGDMAVRDIISALKRVDSLDFDVIILARGGGSLEDLMPFNDEDLAYTIYNLKTPLISAIGHETDYTITDFVADYRAPTPTAAAEYVVFDLKYFIDYQLSMLKKISVRVNNNLNFKKSNVTDIHKHLKLAFKRITIDKNRLVFDLSKDLKTNLNKVIINKAALYDKLNFVLNKVNPLNLMKSGYFKIEKEGVPIVGVSSLLKNDNIKLFSTDGYAEAIIANVKINTDNI